jgi:protein disulfide-isomerase
MDVDGWTQDHDAAFAAAKQEKKLVLADFTGSDWCGWCVKLKGEVFDTPEFTSWAKQNVVLLEVDFPRRKPVTPEQRAKNDELAARYRIQGYPTILFLDASGKPVGQMGYEAGGPAHWIAHAQRIVDSAKA